MEPNNAKNILDIENDLGDWKPRPGMSVDSEQTAYDFYNAYEEEWVLVLEKVMSTKTRLVM